MLVNVLSALREEKEKSTDYALADFHGASIFIIGDCKLPHDFTKAELGRDMHNWLPQTSVNYL